MQYSHALITNPLKLYSFLVFPLLAFFTISFIESSSSALVLTLGWGSKVGSDFNSDAGGGVNIWVLSKLVFWIGCGSKTSFTVLGLTLSLVIVDGWLLTVGVEKISFFTSLFSWLKLF